MADAAARHYDAKKTRDGWLVLLAGQPVTGVLIGLVIARLLIARHLGGKSKFAYEKGDIAMGETWPRMGKMITPCDPPASIAMYRDPRLGHLRSNLPATHTLGLSL